MLTGLSVAYGTKSQSETAITGLAQEVEQISGEFRPVARLLQVDSLYDLASLTKLTTAVATMALIERGRLRLDEYVGNINPRFVHLKETSVFDVLSFRASLKTPGRIDETGDRDESLRRLFAVKLCDMPAVRVYSDINAMVMKYVVEAKCGMPFFDALDQLIFSPAGMKETYAVVPDAQRNRCVCYNYEHRIAGDRFILRTDTPLGTPHDPKALALSLGGRDLCEHAGLFSTQRDMIRFAQALLCGEIIRRDSLLAIGKNYTGCAHPDGTWRQYLGFLCFSKHPYQRLSEVPEWMQESSIGLSGFTGNHLSIDPEQERFVLFLGNRCHNRVSSILPSPGSCLGDYGVSEDGVGQVCWNDGRMVSSSAKYVYFKDKLLHAPIKSRMQELGWLR